MKTIYLAADGDDVGRTIEFFIVMEQIEKLSDFSKSYNAAMIWLSEKLTKNFAAKIIFSGGDSLLVSSLLDEPLIDNLEQLRVEFFNHSQTTISFGIGDNPRQAYFALKLAKASGKNRIEIFKEFIK